VTRIGITTTCIRNRHRPRWLPCWRGFSCLPGGVVPDNVVTRLGSTPGPYAFNQVRPQPSGPNSLGNKGQDRSSLACRLVGRARL
jgi:hypothetical protein